MSYRDEFNLSRIRFHYDNGVVSPWCATKDSRDDDTIRSVDIDHRKKITGVQMRVYEDGSLEGLRLIDETGAYQMDETWYTFEQKSEWSEVLAVPEGQDIIGFRCESFGTEIEKLAFMLW